MRLSVFVSHGSTLEPRTTLTEDAWSVKAAAEADNSCTVIISCVCGCVVVLQAGRRVRNKLSKVTEVGGPKTRELACTPVTAREEEEGG